MMKKIIKKISPFFLLEIYYYITAFLGAMIYGFPGKKMIVIGVTGTKGKTSTINFIWACLSAGGYKTGIISTANIRIGEKELPNTYHMTMPGRSEIQRLMSEMLKSGCKFCIVETTSEGIKQYRHIGVYYDMAVFTNLSPEHMDSHGGSFENYKKMKTKMFEIISSHTKIIDNKKIEKIIVVNKDSSHANDFLSFSSDKKITFSINENKQDNTNSNSSDNMNSHSNNNADYTAHNVQNTNDGVQFDLNYNKNLSDSKSSNKVSFRLNILGKFNVYNVLPAVIISHLTGISDNLIAEGLSKLKIIPGRMEVLNEGQDFIVIVDYAHEKQSMTNVLQTANDMKNDMKKNKENSSDKFGTKEKSRVIVLLGAEGGGRDKAKRPIMGEVSAKLADYVIISNVDPYDDDPRQILEDIAISCQKYGKIRGQNLFVIEDRREGIKKALSLAQRDDIVIITGKGAEQSMVVGNSRLPWDDRKVVREELLLMKSR